jgi:hypothetical protein
MKRTANTPVQHEKLRPASGFEQFESLICAVLAAAYLERYANK